MISLCQVGNLLRCQKYAQTGLVSWIPSFTAQHSHQKPISEIMRCFRPWLHSTLPTSKLQLVAVDAPPKGQEGSVQSSSSRLQLKYSKSRNTVPRFAAALWVGRRYSFKSLWSRSTYYCCLYRRLIGTVGDGFVDVDENVVRWSLRDPERATVCSSGLAQPITPTEDRVSPCVEAAGGS